MKCSEIEQKLSAYLDEALQNEERVIIENHLAQCGHCRYLFEDLQKTKNILGGLDEIEPPPWLEEKIVARINQKETGKDWVQRFFFPLRVKVPIQALATVLVIVLSVYIYKSTTPELAHMDRPHETPRISDSIGHAGKLQIDTKKHGETGSGGEQKKIEPKKKVVSREKVSEKPVPADLQLPAATVPDGSDTTRPGIAGKSSFAPEKNAAFDDSPRKGSGSKLQTAPKQEKIEQYTMRGMATQKEKSQEYPAPAAGLGQVPSNRITATSDDPSEAIRKVHRIMISLSATGIREKTDGSPAIVSGWINPGSLPELKNKIAAIALIVEGQTKLRTDETGPQFVEIVILEKPANP